MHCEKRKRKKWKREDVPRREVRAPERNSSVWQGSQGDQYSVECRARPSLVENEAGPVITKQLIDHFKEENAYFLVPVGKLMMGVSMQMKCLGLYFG